MTRSLAIFLAVSLSIFACDKEKDSAKKDDDKSSSASKKKSKKSPTAEFDGDEAGANKLLKHLMDDDTDRAEITEALKPHDDDYEAVFKDDAAAEAKKGYKKLFDKFAGSKIEPKAGQTELKLFSASTEDLKTSDDFPGGYKKIAGKLKKGLTFYAWKFVKPGESSGMAYDGLVHVNDHWAWFPKPWMALAAE